MADLDPVVAPWLDSYETTLAVPSLYRIWRQANAYLEAGDSAGVAACERLMLQARSSVVPAATRISRGVNFGYGGIGVVIHRGAYVGFGASISQLVTLGSGSTSQAKGSTGDVPFVAGAPILESGAFIGPGAIVTGAVRVGALSIVTGQAAVTHDVAPGTVVGGVPARVIKRLDRDGLLKVRGVFTALRGLSDEAFMDLCDRVLS